MILSEKYSKIEILTRYPLGHHLKGIVVNTNENHFIKILNPPKTLPEELYQDIIRNQEEEAHTLRKMRTNKIIRCLYHEREKDTLVIGFQYPDIPCLSEYLREHHPLSPDLVVNLLHQLSTIFSLLFSREIHRFQLEPNLLFIIPENHKISYLDTGLVNLAKFPETIRLAYLDGQPQFLPPELLKAGELGAASEVYLFAVFAYYLFTANLPHNMLSPVATASLCISEDLPPLDRFRDERESKLNKWIARASAQNPSKRISSLDEFFNGLQEILFSEQK